MTTPAAPASDRDSAAGMLALLLLARPNAGPPRLSDAARAPLPPRFELVVRRCMALGGSDAHGTSASVAQLIHAGRSSGVPG